MAPFSSHEMCSILWEQHGALLSEDPWGNIHGSVCTAVFTPALHPVVKHPPVWCSRLSRSSSHNLSRSFSSHPDVYALCASHHSRSRQVTTLCPTKQFQVDSVNSASDTTSPSRHPACQCVGLHSCPRLNKPPSV